MIDQIEKMPNPVGLVEDSEETRKRLVSLMRGSEDTEVWKKGREQAVSLMKNMVKKYDETMKMTMKADPEVFLIGDAEMIHKEAMRRYVTAPVMYETIHAFSAARRMRLIISGLNKSSPAMFAVSMRLLDKDPSNKLPRGVERRMKRRPRRVNVSYEEPIEFSYAD